MCKYGLKLERWSLISSSGSRVGLNVIDNLINILDCFCPFQVFVTILSFLIEQLCGLKLGFKLSSVFGSSQPGSEFFNLCLTFREVRYEPDECFLGIGHGLENALGLLSDYMKRKRNRLVSFKITIRATFQRGVILTHEVSDWFESFLLPHNKLNGLLLAISHELGVSDTSLFPLLVAPSEKLSPDLH